MTNLIEQKTQTIKEDYKKALNNFSPPRYDSVKVDEIPVNVLSAFKNKKGIYLWGECGTGKTHILYALKKYQIEQSYNWAIQKMPQDVKEGKEYSYSIGANMLYRNFPNLLREIRNSIDTETRIDVAGVLKEFQDWKYNVLVLDDVGAEKFSEWSIENLYEIVNTCYEQMIPLIISSNLSIKDLAESVGDRIPSRISEMCEVIKLTGKDKRI